MSIPKKYSTRTNFNTPPGINTLDIGSRLALKTISHSDYPDGGEAAGTETDAVSSAVKMVSPPTANCAMTWRRMQLPTSRRTCIFGTVSLSANWFAWHAMQFRRRPGVSGRTARNAGDNTQVWIDELVWREFFNQVLFHLPRSPLAHFAPFTGRSRLAGQRDILPGMV